MTDLRDVAEEAVRKARQRKLKLVVPGPEGGGDENGTPPPLPDPADPVAFPSAGDAADIASGTPPSNARIALDSYQSAVRKLGAGPDDPLTPILQGLGQVGMAMGDLADAMPARLDAVIERAERASAAHLAAAREAAEAERAAVLREMAGNLGPLVRKEVARGVRRFDRMLAVSIGGGLALGLLVAGAGGYFYGRASMDGEARATEAALSAAFAGGVAAAGEWQRLIQANAGAAPLSLCKDGKAQHGAGRDGRRWCAVPLWLDPPKPEVPR